jgi:hypothetical protein
VSVWVGGGCEQRTGKKTEGDVGRLPGKERDCDAADNSLSSSRGLVCGITRRDGAEAEAEAEAGTGTDAVDGGDDDGRLRLRAKAGWLRGSDSGCCSLGFSSRPTTLVLGSIVADGSVQSSRSGSASQATPAAVDAQLLLLNVDGSGYHANSLFTAFHPPRGLSQDPISRSGLHMHYKGVSHPRLLFLRTTANIPISYPPHVLPSSY